MEASRYVAEILLSLLEFAVPWLTYAVGWVRVLFPLMFFGYCVYLGLMFLKQYLKQGNPTDYSILVRNGEMVKCGIGLSTWALPGDIMVSFPSHIRSIAFDADQVTVEMQGVNVRGQLFYSVYREGDGPHKLYKAFGKDLQRQGAPAVSSRLSNMTVAVIRDKIANSTIDDLLKNREKLRAGIKKDLAPKLKEWGMWLETVEISDVNIASNTLFSNMQAETKEAKRLEATMITAESGDEIRTMQMKRNFEYEAASQVRQNEE